ncbi:MAG: hypothetical protein KDD22_02095 [Bdellovibrionales bacterium]|nr:hypothetical protein [Bdellovibrionales bacterium]
MNRHSRRSQNHQKNSVLQGIVKRHPDGFGFFIPDNPEFPDVYIPRQEMSGIMTNDRLSISSYPERGGHRFRGEVIEILSRANTRVMGKFEKLEKYKGVIRDRSGAWGSDLVLDTGDIEVESGKLV